MFMAKYCGERSITQHIHEVEVTKNGDEPKQSPGQHCDHFNLCHVNIFYSFERTCVQHH